MSTSLLADAMAAVRYDIAVELCRAIDTVIILEKCEHATGRKWVTTVDRARVKVAQERWTGLRG